MTDIENHMYDRDVPHMNVVLTFEKDGSKRAKRHADHVLKDGQVRVIDADTGAVAGEMEKTATADTFSLNIQPNADVTSYYVEIYAFAWRPWVKRVLFRSPLISVPQQAVDIVAPEQEYNDAIEEQAGAYDAQDIVADNVNDDFDGEQLAEQPLVDELAQTDSAAATAPIADEDIILDDLPY